MVYVSGKSLVNENLGDKSKSQNDITKTRKGMISESMQYWKIVQYHVHWLEFVMLMVLIKCAVGRYIK